MPLSFHQMLEVRGTTKLKKRKMGLFMTSGLLSVPLQAANCQNPDTLHLVSKGQHAHTELCKFKCSSFLCTFLQVLDLLDLR